MLYDITLKVTPEIRALAPEKDDPSLVGHLGTHFDVMDKEFPLEYTRRDGIIFDVSTVCDRDIDLCDIDIANVHKGQFVAFYTGHNERQLYGTKEYFANHPQLSHRLIGELLDRGISIIGIDCSGIRRGKDHTPTDKLCADRNVFVVENLYGLSSLIVTDKNFTAHTYPINYSGMTGLPCRVIAEI